MKRALAVFVLSMWLAGCGGETPACGDTETLELLEEAIYEKAEELEKNFGKDSFLEIADTHEISNVRGNAYDPEIDSYQCDARVTYRYNGNERSVDFEYRIDTDQSSGETLIEYETKLLGPIAVLGSGGQPGLVEPVQ